MYEDASICSQCIQTEEVEEEEEEKEEGQVWDLTRVLEGNCKLWLLKFEDKGGKAVGLISTPDVDLLAQQRSHPGRSHGESVRC